MFLSQREPRLTQIMVRCPLGVGTTQCNITMSSWKARSDSVSFSLFIVLFILVHDQFIPTSMRFRAVANAGSVWALSVVRTPFAQVHFVLPLGGNFENCEVSQPAVSLLRRGVAQRGWQMKFVFLNCCSGQVVIAPEAPPRLEYFSSNSCKIVGFYCDCSFDEMSGYQRKCKGSGNTRIS